ncbi:MAG: hypothetical protein A2X22_07210 [Bacteroidetes bacterium GWF2_49_14]|nr:MAG: hypothetical protein A2X22_07210 [Bacteroidetes bacterium GWF2_49_14]HBB91599.1 hypothetical protein [Bacteroidales bacterium]
MGSYTKTIVSIAFLMAGSFLTLASQTNMFISNPEAFRILQGDYNPADYRRPGLVEDAASVRMGIIQGVDSKEQVGLLRTLETFYNRNSGSDTLSNTTGIGACRTWILAHFDQVNKQSGGRLVTGYLEFDADICTKGHHKNPFILIPGTDTSARDIILVEGHFDTRNEDRCDNQGFTPGIEDNGSGTILIMELARVLSNYAFKHTILLTTPTGEDQGLWGAKAWAGYLSGLGVGIRAVLNNDIVGGIYCGKTSPGPSCPYYGHIDSTHVRIFSYSAANSYTANSAHKQLARYMKYIQDTKINPYLDTKLIINIMAGEDRDGRGGDHTPFRQKGYTAVRIISANEHGNGTGTFPDRNHSTRDMVGKDIDGDGNLDSLYINPGYLGRNTILNGVVAAILASAPEKLKPTVTPGFSGATIDFTGIPAEVDEILVGIRYYKSRSFNFDTLYTLRKADHLEIPLDPGQRSYVSVAPVSNGVPGLFSSEYEVNLTGTDEKTPAASAHLMRNYPNPWNQTTTIEFQSDEGLYADGAVIEVHDLLGRLVHKKVFDLVPGMNEITLQAGQMDPGIYSCVLKSAGRDDERIIMVKK